MQWHLSGFHNKNKVIHVEAGLRTYNKNSPFPEEVNRVNISRIADIHLCPTKQSVSNLNNEGIKKNVYLTGNTVSIVINFFIPHKSIEKNSKLLI